MMSTPEEILLQPVDNIKGVDGRHTAPTEALEQDDATDNTQGTSSSSEGTTVEGTTSRWMTVFTTVATLLSNSFLNAGISMIAPFYPIVVSCIPVVIINKALYIGGGTGGHQGHVPPPSNCLVR